MAGAQWPLPLEPSICQSGIRSAMCAACEQPQVGKCARRNQLVGAQYPDLRQVPCSLCNVPWKITSPCWCSITWRAYCPMPPGQTPAAAGPVAELWRLDEEPLNANPATRPGLYQPEALLEPFAASPR